MKREFNETGLCVRSKHYMVDTSRKMRDIFEDLIERGKYFSILGGRQFGKTTTISLLDKIIGKRDDYLLIRTSFEGVGDLIYENEKTFSEGFLMNLYYKTKIADKKLSEEFKIASEKMEDFESLSEFITTFAKSKPQKIVLIIDEVDKSSDNQTFLHFLGMLREKYLLQNEEKDYTFHSVILAGVHDIKTIKLKARPNESQKLNSPWNIAVELNVDLSFQASQIVTLLDDFLTENPDIHIPKEEIADKIYYYTNGYPYLVSKMCKIIHENIIKKRDDKNWYLEDVETAFNHITASDYQTTLYDSMFKNLMAYEELHETVKQMIMGGKSFDHDVYDPVIKYGTVHSLFKKQSGNCVIHNRIFEQRIFSYFTARTIREGILEQPNLHENFYNNEILNLDVVLLKFQEFMKENYSFTDKKFIEREGRLIFLSFLKSITEVSEL